MESKILKPYRGFNIEKSWETNLDGTIKKDTIVYTAYNNDGCLYDGDRSLAGIKRLTIKSQV